MTSAFVILVSDAIGTGDSGPDWAAKPRDGTDTAPWPVDGHGSVGLDPATRSEAGTFGVSDGCDSGRSMRAATASPAAARSNATTATPSAHQRPR